LNLKAVSENYQELSRPWHHDTVLHKAADVADSLQWQTTKKGWHSIFGAGWQKTMMLHNIAVWFGL